jgi:hypothetical protein
MKIPSSLKVGAHTFEIVRAPLDDKVGETNTCDCKITLHDDLKDSVLGAAFIHEIIHACNSTLGDTALGHALIDSLSEQLYQVLSDNGLLAEETLPLTKPV